MDKWIDRLLETSWFLKVVALILAFFLFQSVYDSNNDTSIINVATRTDTAIIKDVPVTAYYDSQNLVITGIPETVDVTLSGPVNVLQAAKIQKDFEVYVNLQEVLIGQSEIIIQIRNLSDKLKVELSQTVVKIDVQEKVTENYSVSVQYNQAMIESGYQAEEPDLAPNKVTITGAKNVVQEIAYVKATVDLDVPVTSTIQKQAEVIALDAKMNKLDVTIEPSTVEVVIPIKQLSKEVPLVIVEENTLPSDIAINSIQLAQDQVKIFGTKEALDATEKVEVRLNLAMLNDSGTYALPLVPIDGITQFNPSTIQAKIDVRQLDDEQEDQPVSAVINENRIFANIPVHIRNLNEKYEAVYSETTSLNVSGPANIIYKLTANDFKVELDAANLKDGTHNTAIIVNGPSNITWQLDQEMMELIIRLKKDNQQE